MQRRKRGNQRRKMRKVRSYRKRASQQPQSHQKFNRKDPKQIQMSLDLVMETVKQDLALSSSDESPFEEEQDRKCFQQPLPHAHSSTMISSDESPFEEEQDRKCFQQPLPHAHSSTMISSDESPFEEEQDRKCFQQPLPHAHSSTMISSDDDSEMSSNHEKQQGHNHHHQYKNEEELIYKRYRQKLKRNPKVPKGCHPCEKCGKTFVYYSQLRQHFQRHTTWKCTEEYCTFEYHDRGQLISHLIKDHAKEKDQLVSAKPQKCPICSRRFATLKEVTEHREVHDANGIYPCKLCGKTFFFWQTRKTHQKKCHNEINEVTVTVKVKKEGGRGEGGKEKRVKRAYRRRKPKEGVISIPPCFPGVVKHEEDTVSAKDSDTPLDLSMKTTKLNTPKKRTGGDIQHVTAGTDVPSRNKVTTPKKRLPPKERVAVERSPKKSNAAGNRAGGNEKSLKAEHQDAIRMWVARKNFVWDEDVTNACAEFVRRCNEAAEQVRESYFGKHKDFKKIDLVNQGHDVPSDMTTIFLQQTPVEDSYPPEYEDSNDEIDVDG